MCLKQAYDARNDVKKSCIFTVMQIIIKTATFFFVVSYAFNFVEILSAVSAKINFLILLLEDEQWVAILTYIKVAIYYYNVLYNRRGFQTTNREEFKYLL